MASVCAQTAAKHRAAHIVYANIDMVYLISSPQPPELRIPRVRVVLLEYEQFCTIMTCIVLRGLGACGVSAAMHGEALLGGDVLDWDGQYSWGPYFVLLQNTQ